MPGWGVLIAWFCSLDHGRPPTAFALSPLLPHPRPNMSLALAPALLVPALTFALLPLVHAFEEQQQVERSRRASDLTVKRGAAIASSGSQHVQTPRWDSESRVTDKEERDEPAQSDGEATEQTTSSHDMVKVRAAEASGAEKHKSKPKHKHAAKEKPSKGKASKGKASKKEKGKAKGSKNEKATGKPSKMRRQAYQVE